MKNTEEEETEREKEREKQKELEKERENFIEKEKERAWYGEQGPYHTFSFLEPQKMFQNSVSLFQKRGEAYNEPVYTNYP